MLKSVAVWLLNNYLGNYLENFNADHLSFQLLQGQVDLEKIPFRRDAFRFINDTIQVERGVVGRIRLKIPITQFLTKPWEISLSNIYIVARDQRFEEFDGKEMVRIEQEMKMNLLDVFESDWLDFINSHTKNKLSSSVSSSSIDSETQTSEKENYSSWLSYGKSFIVPIVENIQLKITDLHFRLESSLFNDSLSSHQFALGFYLHELSANSDSFCSDGNSSLNSSQLEDSRSDRDITDEYDDVSVKSVVLKNVAIYASVCETKEDSKDVGKSVESFMDKMDLTKLSTDENGLLINYILHPVCANAVLKQNRSVTPLRGVSSRFTVDLNFDSISVDIDQLTIRNSIQVGNHLLYIHNIKKHWKYRPIESVEANPRGWWHYCIMVHLTKIRDKREKTTWYFVLKKARENIEYVHHFKDYLYTVCSAKENYNLRCDTSQFMEVEKERSYDELRILREVAINQMKLDYSKTNHHPEDVNVKSDEVSETVQDIIDSQHDLKGHTDKNWSTYNYFMSYFWADADTSESMMDLDSIVNKEVDQVEHVKNSKQVKMSQKTKDSNFRSHKDDVFAICYFNLKQGSFSLFSRVSETDRKSEKFCELEFMSTVVEFQTKPRIESYNVKLKLSSMQLRDCTMNSGAASTSKCCKFPLLINPFVNEVALVDDSTFGIPTWMNSLRCLLPGNSGSSSQIEDESITKTNVFFNFEYEVRKNFQESKFTHRIVVASQPLDIVCEPDFATKIMEFFSQLSPDFFPSHHFSESNVDSDETVAITDIYSATMQKIQKVKDMTRDELFRTVHAFIDSGNSDDQNEMTSNLRTKRIDLAHLLFSNQVQISCYLSAPQFIFPCCNRNISSDPKHHSSCTVLLIDLGNLCIENFDFRPEVARSRLAFGVVNDRVLPDNISKTKHFENKTLGMNFYDSIDDEFCTPATSPRNEPIRITPSNAVSVPVSSSLLTSKLTEFGGHEELSSRTDDEFRLKPLSINIHGLQAIIGHDMNSNDWRKSCLKVTSPFHVLDRFRISIVVEHSKIVDSSSARTMVNILIPQVVIHVDEYKIKQLSEIYKLWFPENQSECFPDSTTGDSKSEASSINSHVGDVSPYSPSIRHMDSPSLKTPLPSKKTDLSNEKIFSIIFSIPKMSIDIAWNEKRVAELQIVEVCCKFIAYTAGQYNVQMSLYKFLCVDAMQKFGPAFDLLISSNDFADYEADFPDQPCFEHVSGFHRSPEPTGAISPISSETSIQSPFFAEYNSNCGRSRVTSGDVIENCVEEAVNTLPLVTLDVWVKEGSEKLSRNVNLDFNFSFLKLVANPDTIFSLCAFFKETASILMCQNVSDGRSDCDDSVDGHRKKMMSCSTDASFDALQGDDQSMNYCYNVSMSFRELEIIVLRSKIGRIICKANLCSTEIFIDHHGSKRRLKGRLGSLNVTNHANDSYMYHKVFSIGNVIRDTGVKDKNHALTLATSRSSIDHVNTEVQVSAELASAIYVHCPEFLRQLYYCAEELREFLNVLTHSIQSKAVEIANEFVGSISNEGKFTNDYGRDTTKVVVDCVVQTPVVVLPYSIKSSKVLVLYLGTISLTSHDFEDYVIDVENISIKYIDLEVVVTNNIIKDGPIDFLAHFRETDLFNIYLGCENSGTVILDNVKLKWFISHENIEQHSSCSVNLCIDDDMIIKLDRDHIQHLVSFLDYLNSDEDSVKTCVDCGNESLIERIYISDSCVLKSVFKFFLSLKRLEFQLFSKQSLNWLQDEDDSPNSNQDVRLANIIFMNFYLDYYSESVIRGFKPTDAITVSNATNRLNMRMKEIMVTDERMFSRMDHDSKQRLSSVSPTRLLSSYLVDKKTDFTDSRTFMSSMDLSADQALEQSDRKYSSTPDLRNNESLSDSESAYAQNHLTDQKEKHKRNDWLTVVVESEIMKEIDVKREVVLQNDVSRSIIINFEALDVMFNLETWTILLDITSLSSYHRKLGVSSGPPKSSASTQLQMSDTTCMCMNYHFNQNVSFNFSSLNLFLNNDVTNKLDGDVVECIAKLQISGLCGTYKVDKNGDWEMGLNVEGFIIQDMAPDVVFEDKFFSSNDQRRDEKFLVMKYSSVPISPERNTRVENNLILSPSMMLSIKLRECIYLHTNRFYFNVYNYIDCWNMMTRKVVIWRKTYDELVWSEQNVSDNFSISADSRDRNQNSTEEPLGEESAMAVRIDVESPKIILPVTEYSQSLLCIDLGNLSVMNKVKYVEYYSDNNDRGLRSSSRASSSNKTSVTCSPIGNISVQSSRRCNRRRGEAGCRSLYLVDELNVIMSNGDIFRLIPHVIGRKSICKKNLIDRTKRLLMSKESLLQEKMEMTVVMKRNLIPRLAPDSSNIKVEGVLNKWHCRMQSKEYALVRDIVLYNLGEYVVPIVTKIRNLQDSNKESYHETSSCRSTNSVVFRARSHLCIELELRDVIVDLLNDTTPEKSFGRICFVESKLVYESFTDMSMNVDLVSQNISVIDTRKGDGDSSSCLLLSCISDHASEFQTEVHFRSSKSCKKLTIILNSMRLLFLYDWFTSVWEWITLNDEGSSSHSYKENSSVSDNYEQIFKNDSSCYSEFSDDLIVYPSTGLINKNYAYISASSELVNFDIQLNVTNSEIILLSDEKCFSSHGLVLRSTIVLGYRPSLSERPFSCNLYRAELLLCRLNSNVHRSDLVSIIDPVTLNVEISSVMNPTHTGKSTNNSNKGGLGLLDVLSSENQDRVNNFNNLSSCVAEVQMQTLVVKLSSSDLVVVKSIVDSLLRYIKATNSNTAKIQLKNLVPTNDQYWAGTALSFSSLQFKASSVKFRLIDILPSLELPLLELHNDQIVFNHDSNGIGRFSSSLKMTYYNRELSLSESFIEPWQYHISWSMTDSDRNGETVSKCVRLQVDSNDVLNTNVTSSFLETFDHTVKSVKEITKTAKPTVSSRDSRVSHTLFNDTGIPILYFASIHGVDDCCNLDDPTDVDMSQCIWSEINSSDSNMIRFDNEPVSSQDWSTNSKRAANRISTLNRLIIQLKFEGYTPLNFVFYVDKVGCTFQDALLKKSRSNQSVSRLIRLLCDVQLDDNVGKCITIRSGLSIFNNISRMIGIKFDECNSTTHRNSVNSNIVILRPGSYYYVPLQYLESNIFVKFSSSKSNVNDSDDSYAGEDTDCWEYCQKPVEWFVEPSTKNVHSRSDSLNNYNLDVRSSVPHGSESSTTSADYHTFGVLIQSYFAKCSCEHVFAGSSALRRRNSLSSLSKQRAAHIIEIIPPIRVVNLLPSQVIFNIGVDSFWEGREGKSAGQNIIFCPGEEKEIMADVERRLSISFNLEGYTSEMNQIHLKPGGASFDTTICFHDVQHRPLNLHVKIETLSKLLNNENCRNSMMQIKIIAPIWIVNKTGLPLVFKQHDLNIDGPGQHTENEYARLASPLMFSFCESNSDNRSQSFLVMRLGKGIHPDMGQPDFCRPFSIHPGTRVRKLTFSPVSIKQSYKSPFSSKIKTSSSPSSHIATYILGIRVSLGVGRYNDSFIVTLVPRYRIQNMSSFNFRLAQLCYATSFSDPEAKSTHLCSLRNSTSAFHWPRLDQPQILSVKLFDHLNSKWSGGFPIDVATSFHISLRNDNGDVLIMLRVEICRSFSDACFVTKLCNATDFPSPFRIDNFSLVPISFHQKIDSSEDESGSSDASVPSNHSGASNMISVKAGQSMPYALDEPTMLPRLICCAPGQYSGQYDLEKLGPGPDLIYDNFFYIQVSDNNTSKNGASAMVFGKSDSASHPVFDVGNNGKVLLAPKETGKRSQLWRQSTDGCIIHEGSSPPFEIKKQSVNTIQTLEVESKAIWVLDISGPAVLPYRYDSLSIRKRNERRALTQRWKFLGNGKLVCSHQGLSVQVKRRNAEYDEVDAVLGPSNGDHEQEVDILCEWLRPGSGYLKTRVITDGPTRVLQIKDHKDKYTRNNTTLSKKSESTTTSKEYEILMDLKNGLGVSFIFRHASISEELIYGMFSNVIMDVRHVVGESTVIDCSVRDFQVDNQTKDAKYPVVAFLSPPTSKTDESRHMPAIHFRFSVEHRNQQITGDDSKDSSMGDDIAVSKFETLRNNVNMLGLNSSVESKCSNKRIKLLDFFLVNIRNVTINVEEDLLCKLLMLFRSNISKSDNRPLKKVHRCQEKDVRNVNMFQETGPGQLNQMEIYDDDCYDFNDILLDSKSSTDMELSDDVSWFYFANIRIMLNQVRLSVIKSVGSNKLKTDLLKIKKEVGLNSLIQFEDAHIELSPFIRIHFFDTFQNLLSSIALHYRDQLNSQAMLILGSIDFLGNPLGFVNDVSEGVSGLMHEGNFAGLLKSVAHGSANSAAKVTGSLSAALGKVTLDERYDDRRLMIHRKKGDKSKAYLMAGLKGLGFGVLGGLTSVVSETYEGVSQEGLPGFFTGLGWGIVGTVSKPAIGVLDLAQGAATAVRESSRTSSKQMPKKMRLSRLVPDWNLREEFSNYKDEDAVGCDLLIKLQNNSHSPHYCIFSSDDSIIRRKFENPPHLENSEDKEFLIAHDIICSAYFPRFDVTPLFQMTGDVSNLFVIDTANHQNSNNHPIYPSSSTTCNYDTHFILTSHKIIFLSITINKFDFASTVVSSTADESILRHPRKSASCNNIEDQLTSSPSEYDISENDCDTNVRRAVEIADSSIRYVTMFDMYQIVDITPLKLTHSQRSEKSLKIEGNFIKISIIPPLSPSMSSKNSSSSTSLEENSMSTSRCKSFLIQCESIDISERICHLVRIAKFKWFSDLHTLQL